MTGSRTNFLRRTCPHCQVALAMAEATDWLCPTCGKLIVVRDYLGDRWLLTAHQARAFDGK